MNEKAFLQAALSYAQRGWPVLPLRPGEKTPLTTNGFKDATTDEATIQKWWEQTPDANVGIRVGLESGLIVIDVDNKNGKNGSTSLWKLRNNIGSETVNTLIVTTPHGFHLYYTFPDELRDKLLKAQVAEGIDLKYQWVCCGCPKRA